MPNLYKVVVTANIALSICRFLLPVLVHFSVISPDAAKDIQHKAKVAQLVLKPIERFTKPDDDDKKKPRK